MTGAGSPAGPSRGALVEYRVARAIAVGMSRAYLPGRVTGRENLPASGAYLVAPVHRSYVDWLIVARITGRRRLRYIAKAEIWRSKVLGRILESLGVFPVNRAGTDREALERCREVLAGGEPLVMFPEGTRRSGPRVEDLREGVAYLALRAGVPVVPIGIGGSERAMPRGSTLPRPRRVEVVIGKPIYPPSKPPGHDGLPGGEGEPAPHGAGGAAQRAGRVSRRATREFSDEIAAGIQGAFDQAQKLAGVAQVVQG